MCDGHAALLVADSEILVIAHSGRQRGLAQDQAAEESGMLRKPSRGILMQYGRWIYK